MVPTILQGLQKEQILMEVNAKRLSNLRRRHLLKQTQVLQVRTQNTRCRESACSQRNQKQLDWLGELIPVYPKAVPLDPVSGVPTALVLCRAAVTPEQIAASQGAAAVAEVPSPLLPLGWHEGSRKKD
jgi:hypothetical protein